LIVRRRVHDNFVMRKRLHRMRLIACHYRAAEWRHKKIELAAHGLLQYSTERSPDDAGRPPDQSRIV
jgi:hypothetical protein